MRTIKFRAWEISGSGFIAGFNMVNYHGYYNKGLKPSIYRYNTTWEEDEYILEQFTGLKDKNGKEIYEGDIVSGCNGSINGMDWGVAPFEIIYSAEKAKYNVPLWGTEKNQDSTHWIEIIGNIHENPELLANNTEG